MITTLDLGFRDLPKAAGAYLVKLPNMHVLIECGPSACWDRLVAELERNGSSPDRIEHLFITHIHLDHAGACGLLADRGTVVHVHPRGARHLIDPSRLNASARRVFGDALDTDLGTLTACPEDLVRPMEDLDSITVDGTTFTAYETTGHASHHHCWLVTGPDGRHVFTGDAAGMRLPGTRFPTLPMVPPEFDLDLWLGSIQTIRELRPDAVWMTHFDRIDDHDSFLESVAHQLIEETGFIKDLPGSDNDAHLAAYRSWHERLATESAIELDLLNRYCDRTHYQANLTGVRRWLAKSEGST